MRCYTSSAFLCDFIKLQPIVLIFVKLCCIDGLVFFCFFQEFHKSAYKATERKDLLSAINEFLDCSIVLPPGDWERQALLPFRELKAKSEAIRRRQIRAKVKHETQKGNFYFLILVKYNCKRLHP